jgi:hypothetical protein
MDTHHWIVHFRGRSVRKETWTENPKQMSKDKVMKFILYAHSDRTRGVWRIIAEV